MTTECVTNRAELRFAEEVKIRFSFLEKLGFRTMRSEATLVRYESSKIGINIFHGRHSFEISLELESTRAATDTYSIWSILSLVDPKRAENCRCYATRTKEGVAEGVARLAEDFHVCVVAGVLNDNQLFARLSLKTDEDCRIFALETELLQARRKTEMAWHKKDYPAVVKALKPLQGALTQVEIGKLKYAEKKQRGV